MILNSTTVSLYLKILVATTTVLGPVRSMKQVETSSESPVWHIRRKSTFKYWAKSGPERSFVSIFYLVPDMVSDHRTS